MAGNQSGREATQRLIAAMLIFLLGITLILGHVRVYELGLRLEEKYQTLQELQLLLGEKRKARMEALGDQETDSSWLNAPVPEDYIIVHVRESSEP